MKCFYPLLFVCFSSFSQNIEDSLTTDSSYQYLEEMVVSITSNKSVKNKQPQSITTINPLSITLSKSQTSAELMENTGEVYIQKTQAGGGSPVLRGFEANKILLMLDGIRLNNAITRGGHTQQAITIDQRILHNVEVLWGPGSVLYGSDALGGSIHFYTRKSSIEIDSFGLYHGKSYIKFSSANLENSTHTDFVYGKKKLQFLTSFTYSNFGNIRIGNKRPMDIGNWGLQNYYVENVQGKDSMLKNSNPNILQNTAYQQSNFFHKSSIRLNRTTNLTHSCIFTTSSDIDRYDKLNEYKGSVLKYAEWYYGPQKHMINAFEFSNQQKKFFYDRATLLLSHQMLQESRNSRKYNDDLRLTQLENINILSSTLRLNKLIGLKSNINYGFEMYFNDVKSTAFKQNIHSGKKYQAQTRFPNGMNHYLTNGLFAMYSTDLHSNLFFSGGFRYEYIYTHSLFNVTPSLELPFNSVLFNNHAFIGNIGLKYHVKNWYNSILLSKGFRAPNLDDYGKIRTKNGNIIIPTNQLVPEKTYSLEYSILCSKKNINIESGVFYTYLLDAITVQNSSVDGTNYLIYEGEEYRIQQTKNTNKARIYGGNIKLKYNFFNSFSLYHNQVFTFGRDISDNIPLGHIPPVYGRGGITFENQSFVIDFNTLYNFKKSAKSYSPTGVDNLEYALENGSPAWYTLNSSVQWNKKQIVYTLGVNNILDQHIRTFSSGISRGGINIWAKVMLAF